MRFLKKYSPERLLQLFLGVVFLSAGLYRLFHWDLAMVEFALLQTPYPWLVGAIIAFEIIGGIFLISDRWPRLTLLAFVLFLAVGLAQGVKLMGPDLWRYSAELFIFNLSPTDLFLHLTYFLILIYLLKKRS